jgi:cell fate (sporulation/competence/biofilm development) regulator YmcA (YheA/YmcA/DUF963 family)
MASAEQVRQQLQECGHGQDREGGYVIPEYDNRELILREDILARAKELADLIMTTEEVELYRKAEKKIQSHERVQTLIAQIKKKQKELVAFQNTFNNPAMVEKIEREIEAIQDELDQMPIVQQFQQSQTDVNYMLQSIVTIIRDIVAEKLDVEAATPAEPDNCSD